MKSEDSRLLGVDRVTLGVQGESIVQPSVQTTCEEFATIIQDTAAHSQQRIGLRIIQVQFSDTCENSPTVSTTLMIETTGSTSPSHPPPRSHSRISCDPTNSTNSASALGLRSTDRHLSATTEVSIPSHLRQEFSAETTHFHLPSASLGEAPTVAAKDPRTVSLRSPRARWRHLVGLEVPPSKTKRSLGKMPC